MKKEKIIFTVGHSTHPIGEFITMLQSFGIELLADVRSYPGSKHVPQFNKENLKESLDKEGIEYLHLKDLGGRRKALPDSKNTGWHHPAFRGFADYMETNDFKKGIDELQQIAVHKRTAFMCSEALWWRCHRSLIADYLKVKGWTVMHIMKKDKADEHPFTAPAKEIQGQLFYNFLISQ
jgi:uncharacterized protein (DUF488 family)